MNSKKIINIVHKDILYSTIFDLQNINDGLDFITEDDSFIQVGTWNYKKGRILQAHYHNKFERKAYRTQELVFVVDGEITCNLYTEGGDFFKSLKIFKNQLIIQYQGVHEYVIDEDSKILEVKNGPYFGTEKDRTRINVKKD